MMASCSSVDFKSKLMAETAKTERKSVFKMMASSLTSATSKKLCVGEVVVFLARLSEWRFLHNYDVILNSLTAIAGKRREESRTNNSQRCNIRTSEFKFGILRLRSG